MNNIARSISLFLLMAFITGSLIAMGYTISHQSQVIRAYEQVIREIPEDVFLDIIVETNAWYELEELTQ